LVRWTPLALLAAAAVAIPAQAGPAAQSSARAKAGVKAEIKRGTLRITGNRRANKVTLRLKRRRRGILEVDVKSNGKADFAFRRRAFKRILVRGGRGNDTLAISERNGSFVGSERTALEGGRGNDRVVFTGTSRRDSVALSRNGRRLRLRRSAASGAAAANMPVSGRSLERLTVTPAGGADVITVGNLARTGIREATLQLGSRGRGDGAADRLVVNGTGVHDSLGAAVDGARVELAGLGPEVSLVNAEPADGVAFDGRGGADTLHLAATPGADTMTVSAAGASMRAGIGVTTVDADGVEAVRLEPLAGADTVSVSDLAGTDVSQVAADLAAGAGGPADGQMDRLTVNGRGAADNIAVSSSGTAVVVSGLTAGHSVLAADPVDRLTVNGLAGADTLNAAGLAANSVALVLRGGPDADTLTGSPGADTFSWNPGDGADVIGGGGAADTLAFNGSSAGETLTVAQSATPGHIQTSIAPEFSVDIDDVETVLFTPGAGVDFVTVSPITGTDLTQVTADLGPGDGQTDTVDVLGTAAADTITASAGAGGVNVTGVPVRTTVTGAEPALDVLEIQGQGLDDVIDGSALPANLIGLTSLGGLGADIFLGSQGKDVAIGGDGDDVALLAAGDDTFTWNPGDDNDTVEGQAGTDRLLFNGANVAENISIAPNGGRVLFFRNVASVTMDMNDVETIDFNALGGADTITVADMSGTDLLQTNLALAGVGGGGDGAADNVILNGTGGNDTLTLTGGANILHAIGLATALRITGGEPTNDRLTVNGAVGNDTIDASAVGVGAVLLTLNGDAGNDTLTGGDGNDTINGGADVDTVRGGPGADTLDGGGQVGDVVIQD
jgi:Ca2+-binding RTX toxin-like protein